MRCLFRLVLAICFLAVAAFCAYGFLACFERANEAARQPLQLTYGIGGSIALACTAFALFGMRRRK